ncbi:MAG: class I SAM-dependent methyltransferase [Actinomycetota bacterium]|nr:class I SAM-dependent methyltransferase [Actinomycetota bacterium]MDQ3720405.1 class I SAM-dependent methyltransferase [Actinomycetota bacterium]
MSTEQRDTQAGVYGRFWDHYVENLAAGMTQRHGDEPAWPGDEWGSPAAWAERFADLFEPAVSGWERAVEIGPGSGKYTLKVLERSPEAVLRAYDVSAKFLEVCTERCGDHVSNGRLTPHLLHAVDPAQLLDDLEAAGWRRRVDGFYSIDVMVHIDLQYLIVYWLTSALVLRPGGQLVMTLNDVTREPGFEKLLRDIPWTYPAQGRPLGSGKFEWLSPEIIESVLPRLGFRLVKLTEAGRDCHVVAELEDPERADVLAGHLRPGSS